MITNKKKRLRILVVLLIVGIAFINFISKSDARSLDTAKPIKTEYLDKIDLKGFLVLNEKTYTSQGEGVVEYSVRDGERVPKDFVIANLNLMSDVSDLKEELLKIQSAIEYKNQNLNPSISNYEISDKEVNLMASIQDSIVKDDMEEILEAIETLELNTKKNVDISEISSLINLSNQELEDRRDALSKEISTNNVVYKSEFSGVVSYKVDGLEGVYSEENFEKLTYDYIIDQKASDHVGQQNNVKVGDPLYKIIDNFKYYIAIPIDESKILRKYGVGDSVELLVNSKITLNGRVERINKSKGKGVVIVALKEKLSELGYDRKLDISIINDKKQSYVIPSKAIIEVNNQLGVYIVELNGIVKFRPIEVISQNEIDTIVGTGDNKGNIKQSNEKSAKTITSFDEVITEPANIEEGQII